MTPAATKQPTAAPLATTPDPLARDIWVAVLATAVFGLLWLWQIRDSEGFLEADACTHYLISRFAFDEPYRFVDVWGRPFKTVLYALPAWLMGRLGVQAASLSLAVVSAFVAMLLARDLGLKRPGLAFIFTLASPLVFLHAFSELTELPFAALLVVTFYAWTRRWFLIAGLLGGLMPLARPEGFGMLALLALALLMRRHWWALLLTPLGIILWSYAGWEAYGRDGNPITWLPRHWPYAGDSVYQAGNLFKFVALLPAIVGPAAFPGLLLGLFFATRQNLADLRVWWERGLGALRPGAVALGGTLAIPLIVLVAHSLLHALGKMASNGELRYMLVAAPFWGVLVALGWERGFDVLRRSSAEAVRFAGYAAVSTLFITTHVYGVLPIRFDNSWETTRFMAHWAARFGPPVGRPAIMAAHPGIWYFLDRSNNDPRLARDFVVTNIEQPPPGTILLYDPMYAQYNATRSRRVESIDEVRAAGWVELPHITLGGWRVFLSPKPTGIPNPAAMSKLREMTQHR